MILDIKYLPSLGRLFSPVIMDSLTMNGKSPYLTEVCKNSGLMKHINLSMKPSEFFDWMYQILFKKYRNEYIYKNTIANKILLGVHSLNTSHMLTEFRVDKCKADAVILNGTSSVYEIKSEYDTFSRLENQITAYMKVFDKINVITTSSQSNKLKSELPKNIGILVLTDRNTITTVRPPSSNIENIKLEVLFESLRKEEYLNVIEKYFGKIPDVPNTEIFKNCKNLFCQIPIELAHSLTIETLKMRRDSKILNDFVSKVPNSLMAYTISISTNKAKMKKLISFLDTNLETVFIS